MRRQHFHRFLAVAAPGRSARVARAVLPVFHDLHAGLLQEIAEKANLFHADAHRAGAARWRDDDLLGLGDFHDERVHLQLHGETAGHPEPRDDPAGFAKAVVSYEEASYRHGS